MSKPLIVYNKVPVFNEWPTDFWWLFWALQAVPKFKIKSIAIGSHGWVQIRYLAIATVSMQMFILYIFLSQSMGGSGKLLGKI